MVENKTDPQSGLQHPFDKDIIFFNRFPVGFRGCYNCGKSNHFSSKFCLAAKSGNFNKKKFFNEMWAHKPHTKRPLRESVSGNRGSSINGSMNQYNHSNVNSNHHYNNYSNDINTKMGVGNNLNQGVGNNMGVDGNNMGVDGNNMGVDGNDLNMGVGNNMGVDGNNLNMGGGNNLKKIVGNKNSYYRPSRSQSSLTRDINNNPAWMNNSNAKEDEGPKRSKLFVLYNSV